MSIDTSLAATAAAQAAQTDPRDADPSWVRINGALVALPAASDEGGQPAPTLDYESIVRLALGKKPNESQVAWKLFQPGDDDRSPRDYGKLTLTSGPLLRRPGYRFTVTVPAPL